MTEASLSVNIEHVLRVTEPAASTLSFELPGMPAAVCVAFQVHDTSRGQGQNLGSTQGVLWRSATAVG